MGVQIPEVQSAIIKVTSVFAYKPEDVVKFRKAGYKDAPIGDHTTDYDDASTKSFYRDKYYREYYKMMLVSEGNGAGMTALRRDLPIKLNISDDWGKYHLKDLSCDCQDLYLFNHGIGILSLSFNIGKISFQELSNVIFVLRLFESRIKQSDNTEIAFHQFISNQILEGIALRRTDAKDNGDVGISDDYSGSKFKIYSIINSDQSEEKREKLLYELGTGSKIGIVGSNDYQAPATVYYNELMKSGIRLFNNYTALALQDSFTVIGHNIYDSEKRDIKYNTWNKVYFSIYIYNLYIRYNVFRYNTIFNDDEIKTRDEFQNFINRYNMSHISFDFLPNILHRKIHDALGIDEEVAHFEKRLANLATSIQEKQSNRQQFLLFVVSAITGLSSYKEIYAFLEMIRLKLQWDMMPFYSILILFTLIAGFFVLSWLYPHQSRKLKKRARMKLNKG
ncbi:MAG: hypothetical protein ACK5FT_02185 [Sphingomonadales bacterium]